MTIIRIEWVYLVEPVEPLRQKDVDVAMKDVEQQEDVDLHHLEEDHQVLDVDQEVQ
jgi:hypothetical protein